MKKLEKKYNFAESEKKWQNYWEEEGIYKFDWNDVERDHIFSIDTPPPTVSGTLHMGHIFSYTQTDITARYKRMTGKNVFYPIGFDDNGLPTERYIEKLKGVKGKEMPREDFIKLCKENVHIAEDQFQSLFKSVSHSYDWSLKYQTISDTSKKLSQMSFLDLYHKGLLYRKDEPSIWDVADQTALAQTELEDKEMESQMNYIQFSTEDDEDIEIMTTRPELLPACVALICHPDNYEKYRWKSAITPLGVKVPIVADDKVDKEKGTGMVMCCTFGDQTDIDWWKKYKLNLKIIINEKGQINLDCVKDIINKEYLEIDGLKIKDAREKILEILKNNGKITREPEKIIHPVKVGERSKFPIEFLVTKQWNVRVLNIKTELHNKANKCNWYPAWMESRIHDWIDGLSWDWTISRQRFSGIPIPVWYSKRKGEEGKVLVPTFDQLPVDPMVDLPDGYTRDEVKADTDVLDTWATSSISPQLSAWGLNDKLYIDKKRYDTLHLPFDLRPQAHEIIRTWAFCTLVKAYYHDNTIPWKSLAISGWCLAPDKSKMSKSAGNVISPIGLIQSKGSDAVRYWAGNATLGLDTAYSDDLISVGQKLITKLFNSAKFAEMNFENLTDKIATAKSDVENGLIFETIDKWLISKAKITLEKATKFFENYEFNKALEIIENLFWNDFCDNYLEIVKIRCYGAKAFKYQDVILSKEQLEAINESQQSAIRTIYYVFNIILKLFAPFVPAICEEIYSCLYEDEFNKTKSISSRGTWPKVNDLIENFSSLEIGDITIRILSEVRKYKSEQNMSIKEIVDKVTVYTPVKKVNSVVEDLKNVCNVNHIEFINSKEFDIEFK